MRQVFLAVLVAAAMVSSGTSIVAFEGKDAPLGADIDSASWQEVPATIAADGPGPQPEVGPTGGGGSKLLPIWFEPSGDGMLARNAVAPILLDARGIHIATPDGVVDLSFLGARSVKPVGAEPLGSVSNIYAGADPAGWSADVPHYHKAMYAELWDGIDVVFYVADTGVMEFDLLVSPGADPGQARWRITGAQANVEDDGRLRLETSAGSLWLEAPVSSQGSDAVDSWFELDEGELTIELGDYDAERPLLVDPRVAYSSYVGGSSTEYLEGIKAFSNGDYAVGGYTYSGQFINSGVVNTYGASYCCPTFFVIKFDGVTHKPQWVSYVSGSSFGYVYDFDGDDDRVAIIGYTYATNYPSPNDVQGLGGSKPGTYAAFVTSFRVSDGTLDFSTYLGGAYLTYGYGIAVDGKKLYITGAAYRQPNQAYHYPTTTGAYMEIHGEDQVNPSSSNYDMDVFVSVLDATKTGPSALMYSTFLGGSYYTYDQGLTIGYFPNGDIAVGGLTGISTWTPTPTLPFPTRGNGPTGQPFQSTVSNYDGFVARISPAGSGAADLRWSTIIGGANYDYGVLDLEVAPDDSVYITGGTDTNLIPTGVQRFRAKSYGYDPYIFQISADGERMVAGTYLPARNCKTMESGCTSNYDSYYEGGWHLKLTDDEILMSTVLQNREEINGQRRTDRVQPWVEAGDQDTHIFSLNHDLTKANWISSFGGSSYDYYYYSYSYGYVNGGLDVGKDGRIYQALTTLSTNYPTTPGAYRSSGTGYEGAVVIYGHLPPIPVITAKWDKNDDGNWESSQSQYTSDDSIYEWEGKPVLPGVTYSFVKVHLDGLATGVGDVGNSANDYTYNWDLDLDGDFDDHKGITGASFSHAGRGPKEACMQVKDATGATSEACIELLFVNRPPTGKIKVVPTIPQLCETVTFDARSVTDLDGTIERMVWDYHTGKPGTDAVHDRPTSRPPDWDWEKVAVKSTHFRTAGNYEMSLSATDNEGATSVLKKQFVIDNNNGAPVAKDDFYSVVEGKTLEVDVIPGVLSNDCHPFNLNTMNADLDQEPEHGRLKQFYNGGDFIYEAPTGWTGEDTFTYHIIDVNGQVSNQATVTIDVRPWNTPPVAEDLVIEVLEDTATAFSLLASDDTDPDEALMFEVQEWIDGLSGTAPDLVFKPMKDFCMPAGTAPLSFTYEVMDPLGEVDTGTVTIVVTCVQDIPVAENDVYPHQMDGPAEVHDVMANDWDPDTPYSGDTISLRGVMTQAGVLQTAQSSAPTKLGGTVRALPDGTVEYTPPANTKGLDSYAYRIIDDRPGTPGSGDGVVTVSLFDPHTNQPPVAIDQLGVEVFEDEATSIELQASDVDDHVGVLSFSVESPTALGGTVEVVDGATVLYTPPLDACRVEDSFVFHVYDPSYRWGKLSNTDAGSVSVDLRCVNDAPRPVADFFVVPEDTSRSLDVLRNDDDVDSGVDSLRIVAVSSPTHGQASFSADGIWFTPGQDMVDDVSFTYTVRDPQGLVATAAVTVQVTQVNDAPYTNDEAFLVVEDSPEVALDVLRHAVDPEGDAFHVEAIGVPHHGTARLEGAIVHYKPAANRTDSVTIAYVVVDDLGATRNAMMRIDIDPVNDAPTAVDDTYLVEGPKALVVPSYWGVLRNDWDNEDRTLFAYLTQKPQHGTLDWSSDGTFTYTPNHGYRGPDSFMYNVKDQGGLSGLNSATVSLEVVWRKDNAPTTVVEEEFVEEPRVVERVDWEFPEGSQVSLQAVLASGQQAVWRQVRGATVETVTLSDGSLQFTAPTTESSIVLEFEVYGVRDGVVGPTQVVRVRITPVNDAPIVDAGPDQQTTSGQRVTLSATWSDPDNQGIEATSPDYQHATVTWRQVSGTPVKLETNGDTTTFTAPMLGGGAVESLWFSATASDGLETGPLDLVRVLVQGPGVLVQPRGFQVEETVDGFLFMVDEAPGHEYAWDLGDGTNMTGPSVTHSYAKAGSYKVKLTARNHDGMEGSVERDLIIDGPGLGDGVPHAGAASGAGSNALGLGLAVGLGAIGLALAALTVVQYRRVRRRKATFQMDSDQGQG